MIVEAIDKRTGRIVRAEDAYSGQRLECRYCGVDVHPVLGVETPFYRCYEGGEHKNCICKQLLFKLNFLIERSKALVQNLLHINLKQVLNCNMYSARPVMEMI